MCCAIISTTLFPSLSSAISKPDNWTASWWLRNSQHASPWIRWQALITITLTNSSIPIFTSMSPLAWDYHGRCHHHHHTSNRRHHHHQRHHITITAILSHHHAIISSSNSTSPSHHHHPSLLQGIVAAWYVVGQHAQSTLLGNIWAMLLSSIHSSLFVLKVSAYVALTCKVTIGQ